MSKPVIILFYPEVERNYRLPNLPYSLLNLERMVRDLPVEVLIIDERIQPDYIEIIEMYKSNILLIGVSAMIGYQMVSGRQFSITVKRFTNAPIIWGGWFVSVSPDIALQESFIDYVIQGQGEIPFREFTIALLNNQSVETIAGLGFEKLGQLTLNKKPAPVDEKNFPSIDFSKIDVDKIVAVNGSTDCPSLNYIATTGCPYNCSFCCLASVWGKKTFSRETDVVISDLKKLKTRYGIRKLSFDDDHFFGNRRFVVETCEQMIAQNLEIDWEANAHISTFLKKYSDTDLQLIKLAGCRSIRFGVESGDQEVLDRINKNNRVADCLQIAKRLDEFNIRCVFFIMLAFPWNPDKDLKLTLKMLGRAKLLNSSLEAGINFFIPLPSTPLYDEALKYGFMAHRSFDAMVEFFDSAYRAPWWTRDYNQEVRDFALVYFKNAKSFTLQTESVFRKIVFSLLRMIFIFRLKTGFFKCRIDVKWFYRLAKMEQNMPFAQKASGRLRSWRSENLPQINNNNE